ncbi:MAG TPA: Crp/Fnr family transcriptional regulator [Acidobacteriota bacterium]|jgi:CRP-like cAMP-binding protein|nr:Crp/Fnr family transcriptional regulator [Acidobacteriota bacterium]
MPVNTDFLHSVSLFENLDSNELQEVLKVFKDQEFKKGDIILMEEDTGKYMYIVLDGRVKVSRLLPSGKEMILAFHEKGDYFGEMSLIDGGTTPATVTAMSPTFIAFVGRKEFTQVLLENPKINFALLTMLCQRCRDAWTQIEVLTFNNADARIRTALFHLCQRKGEKTSEGVRISLHLTHKEIADMTGISRETATRVLNNLQNQNVLTVETKHYIVHDPDVLMTPFMV